MAQQQTEHLRGISGFYYRQPAELDRRLLVDMGLTREAARTEASKPFWRA